MHSTHQWCLTKHIKTAFSSVSGLTTPKKSVHEGCLTFIFSARLQEDPSQGKSTLPKSRMKQSPLFISSQPMPDNWNGNHVPADTHALADNYSFHTPHSFCYFSTQLFFNLQNMNTYLQLICSRQTLKTWKFCTLQCKWDSSKYTEIFQQLQTTLLSPQNYCTINGYAYFFHCRNRKLHVAIMMSSKMTGHAAHSNFTAVSLSDITQAERSVVQGLPPIPSLPTVSTLPQLKTTLLRL